MKKILKNPFFASSMIMIVGSNFYNVGQFVFHFIAGRLLGKAAYGDLAAIISVLGVLGIILLSANLTIVNYIATQKDEKEVSNFVKWIHVWAFKGGLIVGLAMLLLAPFVSQKLKISDPKAVLLLGPIMFFFILASILRSALQGKLQFSKFVASMLTESVVKIILSILLIMLGAALFGATIATLVSVAVSYLVAYYYLRNYMRGSRGKKPAVGKLLKYSVPGMLQGLALTSMYTTDLLLVKYYFSPSQAGLYASLAILGRVVFFGTVPVTQVMFPIISKKKKDNDKYEGVLLLSLILISAFAGIVIVLYSLFPKLALSALYGAQFLEAAPLLWWFALFMGLLSLATNLIQFYLSIGKTKIVSTFMFAAVVQVLLILNFHKTLLEVIQSSIVSATLLVGLLSIYFPYHKKNEKK